MGSSTSKKGTKESQDRTNFSSTDTDGEENTPDKKGTKESQDRTNFSSTDTDGEENTPDNGDNKPASVAKKNDKKRALQAANKRLANEKNDIHRNGDNPMIAIPSDENEDVPVDEKSANQMKKDAQKQQEQDERDKRAVEQKIRDEEANKKARIANLKEQLRRSIDGIMKKYDDVDVEFHTIDDFESDIKDIQRSHGYTTMVHPINKREDLYEKHDKVKTEKSQLVLRVSELAGVRLKHNNPNIADLSDENRASRLSAMFAELYDNEYTDLFEVYSAKLPQHYDEMVVIGHLRDTLEYCYDKCKEAGDKQRQLLTRTLHMDQNIDPDITAIGLQLRLKEFQKKVAKFTIPNLQSGLLNGIGKEESLSTLLRAVKGSNMGSNPHFKHYLDRCTELCWYTQIQDPPVVLDFKPRKDPSDYRAYTKSGPVVDFIVWPVLLLHDNGPILYKGVAQFRSADASGDQHETRKLSQRNVGKPNENKRSPPPYANLPPDKASESSKNPRAVLVVTADADWN